MKFFMLWTKSIKRSKANWLGNIFHRNCHLKHVTEGKIEEKIDAMGGRRREHKQLLVYLNHLNPELNPIC
jgi:transposase